MTAALLLAACLRMPLFGEMDGPLCGDELEECRCSECFTWDAGDPPATYYQIERTTVSTGASAIVGSLLEQFGEDEAGAPVRIPPVTIWCPPRDNPFPREGDLYRYLVHACNTAGCEVNASPVWYRAAPYACWEGGVEVPCYVGSPLMTR